MELTKTNNRSSLNNLDGDNDQNTNGTLNQKIRRIKTLGFAHKVIAKKEK